MRLTKQIKGHWDGKKIFFMLCLLSGIDIRDTQSKEVSVHADFPRWLETY